MNVIYKDIMRLMMILFSEKGISREDFQWFTGLDCIFFCETNKDYSDMQEYKSKTCIRDLEHVMLII